jgi:hypothetical protein
MAQSRGRDTQSWRLERQRRKQIPRLRLGMTTRRSPKEQVRDGGALDVASNFICRIESKKSYLSY